MEKVTVICNNTSKLKISYKYPHPTHLDFCFPSWAISLKRWWSSLQGSTESLHWMNTTFFTPVLVAWNLLSWLPFFHLLGDGLLYVFPTITGYVSAAFRSIQLVSILQTQDIDITTQRLTTGEKSALQLYCPNGCICLHVH